MRNKILFCLLFWATICQSGTVTSGEAGYSTYVMTGNYPTNIISTNVATYLSRECYYGYTLICNNFYTNAEVNIRVKDGTNNLPDGTLILIPRYQNDMTIYLPAQYDPNYTWHICNGGIFNPPLPLITPNQVFFVLNPSSLLLTVGLSCLLENKIENKISYMFTNSALIGSPVAVNGKLYSNLEFPLKPYDKIVRLNTNNIWITNVYDGLVWSSEEPTIEIGEGFFLLRNANLSWIRYVNVPEITMFREYSGHMNIIWPKDTETFVLEYSVKIPVVWQRELSIPSTNATSKYYRFVPNPLNIPFKIYRLKHTFP
jgi:hypothetical protein